jgi:hypothetical protein
MAPSLWISPQLAFDKNNIAILSNKDIIYIPPGRGLQLTRKGNKPSEAGLQFIDREYIWVAMKKGLKPVFVVALLRSRRRLRKSQPRQRLARGVLAD